jgi:hypothetical protein
LGIYFFAGYQYNTKTQGKEGFEALPNSDFWHDFPSLIVEGLRFTSK